MVANVQQYLGIARDVILVLGIPTLLLIGRWLYEQRIDTLREHIETLKTQLEEAKVLRYDEAREIIEAQEALYKRTIDEKESQIVRLGAATGQKEEEITRLHKETEELRRQLAALETARSTLNSGKAGRPYGDVDEAIRSAVRRMSALTMPLPQIDWVQLLTAGSTVKPEKRDKQRYREATMADKKTSRNDDKRVLKEDYERKPPKTEKPEKPHADEKKP